MQTLETKGQPVQLKSYVITGKLRDGTRFKPIFTKHPYHYNIYEGSIWEIKEDGKRKLINRICN